MRLLPLSIRTVILLVLIIQLCWSRSAIAVQPFMVERCQVLNSFIPILDTSRVWQPGRYAVYFHPFPILGQYLKLSFERRMGQSWSLRALGGFGAARHSNLYNVDNMTAGYFEGQIRAYPADKVFHGFYWGAFAYGKIMDFSFQYEQSMYTITPTGRINKPTIIGPHRGTVSALGFGYLMGIQRRIGNRLLIDSYVGPAIQMAQFRGPAKNIMSGWHDIFEKGILDHYSSGMWIQLGFAVGWMVY